MAVKDKSYWRQKNPILRSDSQINIEQQQPKQEEPSPRRRKSSRNKDLYLTVVKNQAKKSLSFSMKKQ